MNTLQIDSRERNNVTKRSNIKVLFLTGAYILFLVALVLALKDKDVISNICWLFVLFSVLAYDCFAGLQNNAWQHLIIASAILFIWLTQIPMSAGNNFGLSALVVKYAGTGIWIFHFLYMLFMTMRQKKSGRSAFPQNIVPILISIIYTVCSLTTFTLWFKSDGYTYYDSVVNGIGKWDFTLNWLSAFTMGGHVSYGYAPFLQAGLFFLKPFGMGIRVVNLVFSIITIFSFHYIVLYFFPGYRQKQGYGKLFFVESIFSLCPLFLGISYEVYTDYAMFFYFIWMVACFVYRFDILGIACAVLLCFSKEFGIFILAGFLASYGIATVFKYKTSVKPIVTEAKRCIGYCIGVIPFLLSLLCSDAGWGQSAKQTLSNNQDMEGRIPSALVFDPDYILTKLKEIFILHYSWLFWVVLLILTIYALRSRAKHVKKTNSETENFAAIIGAFGVFTALQLLYFTYVHYRYLQLYTFFGALLLAWAVSHVSSTLSYTLTGPLAIFLFVESFVTTDLVSLHLFNTINVGHGDCVSTIKYVYIDHTPENEQDDGTFFTSDETSDIWDHVLLDGMMNNWDQTGIEHTTEQALEKISYTENDAIIVSPIYHDLSVFSLWGRPDLGTYYWNAKSGNITTDDNDVSIHLLTQRQLEDETSEILDEYDNVYYFSYPYINNQLKYNSEVKEEQFLSDHNFQFVEKIRQGKWDLLVYRLKH